MRSGLRRVAFVAAFAAFLQAVQAATAAQWRSRSIYQVMTDRFARTDGSTLAPCNTGDLRYCGGTWRGLVDKLDYITGMGFTAVWISPVTYQLQDERSYHGYYQQDLYNLNENFGSAQDLKDLAAALHDRGMFLMVDVVANHNAWAGPADSVDYTVFNPFNKQEYYHNFCEITDYDDQDMVEKCWLGDSAIELVDLKTEDESVSSMYQDWIGKLVSSYAIDGLRVDTLKHVEKSFWSGFSDAAGVFCTGECLSGDPTYVIPYQSYMDSVINYPIYFPLIRAFKSTSGSIADLAEMLTTMKDNAKDSTVLGTFSENHDQPRFASYTFDLSLAKNIIAFTLLSDGVPIVYQGQEQHYSGGADPQNREALWGSGYNTSAPLYAFIASVNLARNRALARETESDFAYGTYQNYVVYRDETTLAMRKGGDGNQIVTVLSNRGEDGDAYTLDLRETGFAEGDKVSEMITCETLTVGQDGEIAVPMISGLPRIYYPQTALDGSGICGDVAATGVRLGYINT